MTLFCARIIKRPGWLTTLEHCPIPLAGFALGVASLGNALETAFNLQGYARLWLSSIASLCLVLLTISALLYPRRIHQILKHPVAGGIVPTFCMGWMTLSGALRVAAPTWATAIWSAAVILHISALVRFGYCRWKERHWQHMAPSWFIPSVGFIVATLNCPTPAYHTYCLWLLGIGMLNLAVLMPLMFYRLFMYPPLDHTAQPTLAILAAPVSLTLAGYITNIQAPESWICGFLAGIALLMTAIAYPCICTQLRRPFTPAHAAFTFPMVIGVIALQKLALLPVLQLSRLFNLPLAIWVSALSYFELLIAVILIIYVTFGFVMLAYHALCHLYQTH